MKAAFVPEPGRVAVGDFPKPQLGDGEVLVKMSYASICGSDLHLVHDGFHRPDRLGRPGWPGHEGVGFVADSDVAALPVGTAVLTVPFGPEGGCFAEYQAIDARQVIALPPDADIRRLLLAQQLGTTIYAMRKFVRDGQVPETAAIIGAGSAGLFFVQLLRAAGCSHITVSDLDRTRLATASELGAHSVVHAPDEAVADSVLQTTSGRGADLVIESAGYDSCRSEAVKAVRERGTIGLFGYPERPGLGTLPIELAFRKSVTMEWSNQTQREPGLRSFRNAIAAIQTGEIYVDHCLQTMFDLENTAKAFEVARNHGDGAAKVGIVINAGANAQ